MIEINIAKDFTAFPGGRLINEGPFSGEEFRINYLLPKYQEALTKHEKLKIDLDGCFGYPSSFIEESFGGLARELKDKNILDNMIIISNDEPSLLEFIEKCVKKA